MRDGVGAQHLFGKLRTGAAPVQGNRYKREALRLLMITLVIFAVFLSAAFQAFAQEDEDTGMGEIIIEGEKTHPKKAAEEKSIFVGIIEPEDSIGKAETVPELISEAVGVNVRSIGGLGSFATLSIRGSSSGQVQIYLDGVPLTGASTGIVNIANISLDNVDRIEIYRGFTPVEFGSSGIGGIINIVTKAPESGLNIGASVMYGSFDTVRTDLYFSQGFERVKYLLFYSHLQSEGDFEFLNDNGTLYNKNDDRVEKRINNDFTQDNFFTKVTIEPFDNIKVSISEDIFVKEEGLPGIGAFQAKNTRFKTFRNIVSLRLDVKTFLGTISPIGYHIFQEEEYRDLDRELGLGRQHQRYTTETLGIRTLTRIPFGSIVLVSLMGELREETFKEKDLIADSDEVKQKRSLSAFAVEEQFFLFDSRVIISSVVRYEVYESDFSSVNDRLTTERLFSPSIGIAIKPFEWITLKANVARYHRVPTLRELFGDRGSIVGNASLESEEGTNLDAGFVAEKRDVIFFDRLFLEYAYFENRVEELIVFISSGQGVARPLNISETFIKGHELSFAIAAFKHFSFSGNYTREHAIDRSKISYLKGNKLPGRPENEVYLLAAAYVRWLKVYYDLNFIDETFIDRANLLKIKSRSFHGAGFTLTPFSRGWEKGLKFNFEAKNITNNRTSDYFGYPIPGRSYFGTLSYKFEMKNKKDN